jgi:hypothetical protein
MTSHCRFLLTSLLALLCLSQVFCQNDELDCRDAGTVCNIMDYGASEGTRDQGADVGPAIIKAYTHCVQKSKGPATLLIPAGKEFRLASHVIIDKPRDLIFQWDGNIHLSRMYNVKGFNLNGAMVQFTHADGVKLQGKGTFFGYGVSYRQGVKNGENVAMEKRPRMIMFFKASNIEWVELSSFRLLFFADPFHLIPCTESPA